MGTKGFGGRHETEAAYILLEHALDFGSGWRKQLHKHNDGKGAWLSIKPGVEKLYDAYPGLESSQLAALSFEEVQEAFGFFHEDLRDLVGLLHGVIRELGTQTMQEYGSLVAFIKVKLKAA